MCIRDSKRAEGKGVGYDRWAAKHNLKQMAATVTAYQDVYKRQSLPPFLIADDLPILYGDNTIRLQCNLFIMGNQKNRLFQVDVYKRQPLVYISRQVKKPSPPMIISNMIVRLMIGLTV